MSWKVSRRSGPPRRHRVSQEDIDAMAELRRQGLAFAEIGTRQGLSERTARRYVGRVERRLKLPQRDDPEPDADPATLRERFAREFMEILYREPRLNSLYVTKRPTGPGAVDWIYGGPPSILFLNEAEKLIREGLDALGTLSLRLLARDQGLRHRFLRTKVGYLYSDYVGWHQFSQNFGETGEDWRPRHERPPIEPVDDLEEPAELL